ncbi:MAG: DegQ family serine endoprotease [Gammaproteobacteria bacterium]|nr:DegQ family serine endoprotease [Gammaproteobacteria bacterium]
MFTTSAFAGLRDNLPDFTQLVEKTSPAVVNISTVQKKAPKAHMRRPQQMPEEGPFGEWFKHFFGEEGEGFGGPGGPERDSQSLGSGFILSADGYVLTNNHVIEDADEIIVRLNDRRELNAEVIGRDERSDLALLKVKATDLPVVNIGKSKELKVGEWVLAIGSPFGFDYSVTSGIVSAKGRSLPKENYVPFIQTDVAINPGNSGGPLFNLDGEVVGINSQIYSRTGGYMGVSFAIPIDVAMNVVEQLKNKGKVIRGWLGVLIQDVTRELAESFGMDKPHGALVARVLPDSPAQDAKFEVGDIIVRFNGREIDHSSDLPPIVGITPIDKSVPVDIIRDGKKKKLMVKIGELPAEDDVKIASGNGNTKSKRIAVEVTAITDEQRERLELNDKGGVLVKEVQQGPAHDAGIRRGDVILTINNVDIKDAKHFTEVVEKLPEGKSVPVLVHRRGSPIFLAMKVED